MIEWLALGSAAGLGVFSAGIFHPRFNLFGKSVWRAETGRAEVALTFDDGPDPEFTPAIARLLAERGVHGNFFVVGATAAPQHDLLRSLIAAGHEVHNHTWSHDTAKHLFSKPLLTADLAKAQEQLRALGSHSTWYRPAVGIRNPVVHAAADALGLKVVTWALAARDGARALSTEKAVSLGDRARAGDVIALHDGRRGVDSAFRKHTLDALPALLDRLKARQLQPVTLTRLFCAAADVP